MGTYLEILRILKHYLPNLLLYVGETKIKKYNVRLLKLQSPVQISGLWSQMVIRMYLQGPKHESYRRRRPTNTTKLKVTGLFQHIVLFGKGTHCNLIFGFPLC